MAKREGGYVSAAVKKNGQNLMLKKAVSQKTISNVMVSLTNRYGKYSNMIYTVLSEFWINPPVCPVSVHCAQYF